MVIIHSHRQKHSAVPCATYFAHVLLLHSITAKAICYIKDFDISIGKFVAYTQMLHFMIKCMENVFLTHIELAKYIFFDKKQNSYCADIYA